jgi:hypothetical protein
MPNIQNSTPPEPVRLDCVGSLQASGINGNRYLARFIQSGRVRARGGEDAQIEIPAEALQQAAADGLFDQRAVFLDHAGWLQHPSLAQLIGLSAAAHFDVHSQSVQGEISFLDNPAARHALSIIQAYLENPSLDIGLSLVFYPQWENQPQAGGNGLGVQRLRAIRYIESIDLVFQPAAGGRILQPLAEPSQPPHSSEGENLTMHTNPQPTTPDTTVETPRSLASTVEMPQSLASMVETPRWGVSTNLASTVETPRSLAPTTVETLRRSVSTNLASMAETPQRDVATDPDGESEPWLNAVRQATTEALLAASGLPVISQQRLAAQPYQTPAALQQAIEAERSYLASLSENQVIQLPGQAPRSHHLSGMRTPLERIELALDAMLNGVRPPQEIQPLTGIRELYHLLSGDYEMTGQFQAERVQFAAVTSSTMANLVANALNKRVINEFQQYPRWWEPVVLAEDFASLQNIKWITLGGVGELPTVSEGAAYSELTWDDSAESASFVKKGGYLGITLETIDKDDTGRVRAAPRALAQAAWLTLSKTISAIFTASSGVGPTLSDGYALFHSNHGNLGSSALAISSYNAARLAMRKQTELNSSERLGALTAPKYLLVPPDLEITALQVLASEYDYTYALSNGVAAPVNPNSQGVDFQARMNFARSRVIVVDLWTDTNNWAACADPRLYPTIGLGFRYGRVPEIFSVASPTAGLMFTNDTMPVKVRFFFAAGPMDYRGLYKANVA